MDQNRPTVKIQPCIFNKYALQLERQHILNILSVSKFKIINNIPKMIRNTLSMQGEFNKNNKLTIEQHKLLDICYVVLS